MDHTHDSHTITGNQISVTDTSHSFVPIVYDDDQVVTQYENCMSHNDMPHVPNVISNHGNRITDPMNNTTCSATNVSSNSLEVNSSTLFDNVNTQSDIEISSISPVHSPHLPHPIVDTNTLNYRNLCNKGKANHTSFPIVSQQRVFNHTRRYKKSRYTNKRRRLHKNNATADSTSHSQLLSNSSANVTPLQLEVNDLSSSSSNNEQMFSHIGLVSSSTPRTAVERLNTPLRDTISVNVTDSTHTDTHESIGSPDNASDYIINLSSLNLSASETRLLNKGLGYCPTPRSINTLELNQDLESFCRRMRLKEFFFDKQQDTYAAYPINPFKPKSTWNPPKRNHHLEIFLEKVCSNIKQIDLNRHVDNLSANERHALRDLRNNPNIVIKPADKGSAVVVLDRAAYVQEGLRQLNNRNAYQPIKSDPTPKHTKTIQNTLSKLDIDDQTREVISPDLKTVKCPQFYMLTKVHKLGNPGRPIVSGCACPTAHISRFVDFHLRPLVTNLPSFIQDTTHFIKHIQSLNAQAPFPPNTLVVSADVTALYTNINHNEGLQACKEYLNTRDHKSPPTDHLTRLLDLVLSLNAFNFNGSFYKQILGIRMGTCARPFHGKPLHGIT